MDIGTAVSGLLHWILLAVFVMLVIAVAWNIWRRNDQPAAFQARAKARGWLGRAWDSIVRFWSR